MNAGEVALFHFDARTGEPRTANGLPPETPIAEYCIVYRRLALARRIAAGMVMLHPETRCAIYAKSGKWLETRTRAGVRRRNEGLGLILLLFRGAVLTGLATLILTFGSQLLADRLGTEHILWSELTPQEKVGVIWLGAAAATIAWYIGMSVRNRIFIWQSRPAMATVGSPLREKFYEQLAKDKARSFLAPVEITLQEVVIEWRDQDKYNQWISVLRENGFEVAGSYFIPEIGVPLEFWLKPAEGLTSCIVNHPRAGMWIDVFTRFEDGSSFDVANKDRTALDPHPTKKVLYLGPEALAEEVIAHARRDRPALPFKTPARDAVVEDYKNGWREYMQWRRSRGTTAEEYKRIDERRHARKMASAPADGL